MTHPLQTRLADFLAALPVRQRRIEPGDFINLLQLQMPPDMPSEAVEGRFLAGGRREGRAQGIKSLRRANAVQPGPPPRVVMKQAVQISAEHASIRACGAFGMDFVPVRRRPVDGSGHFAADQEHIGYS